MEEFPQVLAIASRGIHLWASVGVHPDSEDVHEPSADELLQIVRAHPGKVVAIGETGLDYYRLNGRSLQDMHWQRERFRTHIAAARESGLPLVIHTRAASEDTLRILREEGAGQGALCGVFLCFTETVEVAQAALALGFYISLSGILTFRNAETVKEVARLVPDDRLLVETDSPYLAPVPHRGKTNTPALVPHVAAELARLRGRTPEEMAALTTENFRRLFGVELPA